MVRRLQSQSAKHIAAELWTQQAQGLFKQESISGKEIISAQESLYEGLKNNEIKKELKSITDLTRQAISSSNLTKLDPEIGGQYGSDQVIHINQNQLNFTPENSKRPISQQIQETSDKINHIYKHEQQHAKQKDHLPIQHIGPHPVLILGGVTLSITEVIEGLNMSITKTHTKKGQQVVSNEYCKMHSRFQKALTNSKFNLAQIEKAVQARNLTEVDDRANPSIS